MALCLLILRITGSEQSDTAFSAIHQKLTKTSQSLHQSCAVGFTRRAVILKESRGSTPTHSFLQAMSVRSLLIIALSITVGVGAVTHAKTQLAEQAIQETMEFKELAYRTERYID